MLLINLTLCFILANTVCCFEQKFWEFSYLKDFRYEYFDNINLNVSNDINIAINNSRFLAELYQKQVNAPGIVVGISIKGKQLWTEGFGFTDIENNVKTHKESVWRLASISKPLTSALVANLIDSGKLDFNQSIYHYLPKELYPTKKYNGTQVDIKLKQVMSHTAGMHLSKFPDDIVKV